MHLSSRTGYMFLAMERGYQPMHMGGLQRHLSLRTVAATVTRRIRLGTMVTPAGHTNRAALQRS
jgi:hypothetical protein